MSMLYITVLLFGSLFYLLIKNKKVDKVSKKILSVFLIEWCVVLCISSFYKELDLYKIQSNSYLLLFLNVFFFSMAFVMVPRKEYVVKCDNDIIHNQVEKLCRNPIFKVLMLCCSIYVIYQFLKFWQLMIIMQSAESLRTDYFEGSLYGPTFGLLNVFILSPLSEICVPLFGFKLFFKRDLMCILMGVFLFVYHSLSGGRFGYVQIFLAMFLVLLVFKISNSLRNKLYISAVIAICLLYFLMIVNVGARSGDVNFSDEDYVSNNIEQTNDQLLLYPTGPSFAFNQAVNKYHYVDKLGGYQYGQLTFSSFFSAQKYLFYKLFGVSESTALERFVKYKQSTEIAIGNSHQTWNALYTAPMFFYLDFGLVGVIVFPLFFGIIYGKIVNRFNTNKSIYNFILLTFLFHRVTFSIFDFVFTDMMSLVLVIILIILSNQKKYCLIQEHSS